MKQGPEQPPTPKNPVLGVQCRRYYTFTEAIRILWGYWKSFEYTRVDGLMGARLAKLPSGPSRIARVLLRLCLLCAVMGIMQGLAVFIAFLNLTPLMSKIICSYLTRIMIDLLLPAWAAVLFSKSLQKWLDGSEFDLRVDTEGVWAYILRCVATVIPFLTFLGGILLLQSLTLDLMAEWASNGPMSPKERLNHTALDLVFVDIREFMCRELEIVLRFTVPLIPLWAPIVSRIIAIWLLCDALCRPIRTIFHYLFEVLKSL